MPKNVLIVTLDGDYPVLKSGEDSICVLIVSAGAPYYREDPFKFIIQALNESAFTKIIFVVRGVSPSTLQLEGKTPEEADSLSRQSELEWFTGTLDSAENKGVDGSAKYFQDLAEHLTVDLGDYIIRMPASAQLRKPYEIKLWREISSSILYKKMYTRLHTQYKDEARCSLVSSRSLKPTAKQSSSFYRTVTEAATTFLAAYASNHKPRLTPEQLCRLDEIGINLCVNHILAERAGDPVLAEYGNFIAYPFCCTANDLKLTTLVKQALSDIEKKVDLLDICFNEFPELLVRNPKHPKPKPIGQPVRAMLRKHSDARSEGDVSPKPKSAFGELESVARHLGELTLDPGISVECPEKILSPHAKMQVVLHHIISFAAELDTPNRIRFVGDLLLTANQCLTEPPTKHVPAHRSGSGFDFAPSETDHPSHRAQAVPGR